MTEKFRIQVPADGVGGTIIRVRYLAQRVTEDETRELARLLGAALVQMASRKPIVRAEPPDAPAPKISRRQAADCSPSEKAIVNLVLNLSPNVKPLSLQPWFPGRSVQWISAKLHQEMRARARNSAPAPTAVDVEQASGALEPVASSVAPVVAETGHSTDAGRVLQPVPTRPADVWTEALGNDEGSPASTLQQENDALRKSVAAKNTEIEGLRRDKEAVIEQRILADRAIRDLREQLGAKNRIIDRLRRAQDRAPSTQARPWGLTPGATPMPDTPQLATSLPDTGSIPWPEEKQKMRGR